MVENTLSAEVSCIYCGNVAKLESDIKGLEVYKCSTCPSSFLPEERVGNFFDWTEYVLFASADVYNTKSSELCFYPIEYLTDALGNIGRSELVVIGADTGIGKTQLCNDVAYLNAGRQKNVYLFSLEGDKYDVANRERYKQACRLYFADKERKKIDLSYKDFISNKTDKSFEQYTIIAETQMRKAYAKTLHIYDRSELLNLACLEEQLDIVHKDADLIIIDHLHYFDYGNQSEHLEITKIMKQIQVLKSKYRIPFVIASHLRKKGKDRVFPDNNDFHGSSNIAKQADTCIILAHTNFEDTNEGYKTNVYETGIRITKNRSGLSQNLLGVVNFDATKKLYSDEYTMGAVSDKGAYRLEAEYYPKWAKKRKDNSPYTDDKYYK